MAAKPYKPKMTAAEKKAYKNRNFGVAGKTGGMGGKYGRKSENLSTKQLKAAGGLKAAGKRTVSISQTKRDETRGITLGPGGKPLTGTVKLLNGKTAVYKGGKRVQVAAPKSKPVRNVGTGTNSKPKPTVTRVSPSRRGEGAGSSSASTSTPSGMPNKNMLTLGRAAKPTGGKPFIQYGGTRKPTGKEVGPAVLGVKNPSNNQQYRFGPPNDQGVYRWDAKTKKFVYIRKA